MRWKELGRENCSIARTLAVVGDRWTLLVLRDSFLGVRRFEDFERSLRIARRVLSERLELLVAEDVLLRVPYRTRPARFEYRLTDKGHELYPAILSLVHWGDKHYAGRGGPPVIHKHLKCGRDFRSVLTCSECAEAVFAREVAARLSSHANPSRQRKVARRSPSKARRAPV
jgi:DNA-binding HxlR family transcriptional regulator